MVSHFTIACVIFWISILYQVIAAFVDGLGGYAAVHIAVYFCGLIVATSSDSCGAVGYRLLDRIWDLAREKVHLARSRYNFQGS